MPSSTSKYCIAEPHPSVPSSRYIYSGRGGAGNVSHVNTKTLTAGPDASGPASRASLSSKSTAASAKNLASHVSHVQNSYFPTGRGGAGNMYSQSHFSERPMFSFDEELERQRHIQEQMAPHYLVGRGGAGNAYGSASSTTTDPERRSSATSTRGSSSGSSVESGNSVRNGIAGTINRLRGSFAK